jgi:hypothetical protein
MCHKNDKGHQTKGKSLTVVRNKRYQAQIFKSSTLLDRLADWIAASPSDRTEIARPLFGRTTSSCLVQIHVEAYMLTLSNISFDHDENLWAGNVPINASARETGTHATGREAILFEAFDVPRLDTCGAKQNAAALL